MTVVAASLVGVFLAALPSLHAQSAPIFVTLRTTQVASGTTPTSATTATIAPPPAGWSYSAAAPVAGSTWNQILRPNPGIASGVGATAGTFVMNSANNIALKDANGNSTAVKLSGYIIVGDTTGATRTEPATGGGGTGVLAPTGLMDGAWRIFSGANTTRFTFSGLPASKHYYLYCYGTSGASGCKFDVPTAYLAPGETASKTTTGGNSGNLFVTDGTTYSLYSGTSTLWVRFHVVSDGAGNLSAGTSKNSSSQQFFNGFQLMPFPLATITLPPPATVSATAGGAVTISVTATGDGTLSYRWRKDGVPIDTAANSSAGTAILSLSNVQASDAGSYDVVVTNDGGSVTSSASVLSVGTAAIAPSISVAPASQTATTGGSVNFNVTANGTAPLTYTWQKSNDNVTFTDIAASNSVQLTRANLQTSDAGYYRVVVTNAVGSATSPVATLAIAPVIITQPVGGTVAAGGSATLSAVVDAGAGAPFPTTYVWKKNGATVTDGAGLSGATTASLQFAAFSAANSGVYTLTASNPAGTIVGRSVYLGTPTTLVSSVWPAAGVTGVNPDTPPTIRFSGTPVVGTVGQVRVYDASNDALVETIDLSTLTIKVGGVQTYRYAAKTIGDRTYDYFPIVVVGNEARVALKSSTTLGNNKTYYVQIDPGVLLDSTGASYPGISDKTSWRFTTKATRLPNTAATITVAADGSGDFTTLQGAIDLIPFSPANTVPRTIVLKSGIYNEEINLRIGQNNVTIQGAGRNNTIIQYLNNNDLLPPGGAHFTARSVLRAETTTLALSDLTVRNLTLKGGGQAEAIALQSTRVTIARCNFYSFQDTLFLNQQNFLTDCYVEGDTDFIWGGGAYFQRCELKMMNPGYNTNPRNTATQLGFIFVDCVFSRPSAAAVPDGSGFFSRDFGASASMMALFNCRVGKHIKDVGWSVSATDLSSVRYWEYGSANLDGTPYDVSVRPTWNHMITGAPGAAPVLDHQQVDAITAAYYSDAILVSGFTPAVAPAIETPPTDQAVDAGASAVFKVGASLGYPSATYQWRKNGVAIDSVTNPSAATAQLTVANVQESDVGTYSVVVTNSAGSVTSAAVVLLINGHPPVISTQPVGQIVAPGNAASLSVTAFGFGVLGYQWQLNGMALTDGVAADGTVVAGANTATLALANTQTGHDGTYHVVVTDTNGSTLSGDATVVVGVPPKIASQPASQVMMTGSPASFAVTIEDPADCHYQWCLNGVALPGQTSAALALGSATSADAGVYSVVITNRAGSTASASATLTISNFAVPAIPANAFDATSFGAVGDNATNNTNALQAALNAAGAAGGGTVTVPAGTFLCGPLTLGSNTNLFLAAGCVLKMLPMGQWPNAPYTSGSTPDFIKAENVHDAMVSGSGTIDGQGQAWWDRVDGTNGVTQQSTIRPGSAISFLGAKNSAIVGISTLNTPNINVSIGKDSRYVVVANVKINEPADSPNTDGIHLAGRDILVDRCTVSNGDDNIVINTGTSGPETADITITHCDLLTGHGCSIGSFTNASGHGIRNVTVDGLTFNGTSSGLTLKSAPGRGGVVQDLSYSNLTMNNVGSPFVIYSYYGTVGSAGATGSNRIIPAVAAAYNANPPASLANAATLPEWKNIRISNVTITNATNYSVVWGLPNKPVSGVTFTNIVQNGGFGFEIYNAENVQFLGDNRFTLNSGQPTFTTYNANAIVSQPQSVAIKNGGVATFAVTAIGASGVNGTPPSYRWTSGGAPLVDGAKPDAAVVSGATTSTLSIAGARAPEAGGYAVVVSNSLDTYDATLGALVPNGRASAATSGVASLTFNSTPATVTLTGLDVTYDGAAKQPTVVTSPAGLAVDVNYEAGGSPINAGSYVILAVVTDPNYVGAASGTLTIARATPVIAWPKPDAIVYGTPLGSAQLSALANVPGQFAYAPAAGTILNAGDDQSLAATFLPDDSANYLDATASVRITVNKAVVGVSLAPLDVIYDGAPKAVVATTAPSGLATNISYDGASVAPIDAGTYRVHAAIADRNYAGETDAVLTVHAASATVALTKLRQSYDGTPKTVEIATSPAGLPIAVTYGSGNVAPTLPGEYAVSATITNSNYAGSASAILSIVPTALVRHAPALNGELDGSIQVLTGEDVTLNGAALASGDLLVPGMPLVRLNGSPTLVGTKDAAGTMTTNPYTVTLNGQAMARYLVRRVDPIALPAALAAQPPTGTRSVVLTSTHDSAGDFATVRNLTIRGGANDVAVPAGSYGDFNASDATAFVFGRAGATAAAVYYLQNLNLNGAVLKVAGPVRIVLAHGVAFNGTGTIGNSDHPEWLELQVASGGVTLNGGIGLYGDVLAPNAPVTINGNASIHGRVASDRLTINGNGALVETPLP